MPDNFLLLTINMFGFAVIVLGWPAVVRIQFRSWTVVHCRIPSPIVSRIGKEEMIHPPDLQ
jgi:hypothetical protein